MKTAEVVKFKKKLVGVVTSNKSQKTIVVEIQRRLKDLRYSKFGNVRKKYHAHDEKGLAMVGDKVLIIESKPFSKLKKWELLNVLK